MLTAKTTVTLDIAVLAKDGAEVPDAEMVRDIVEGNLRAELDGRDVTVEQVVITAVDEEQL